MWFYNPFAWSHKMSKNTFHLHPGQATLNINIYIYLIIFIIHYQRDKFLETCLIWRKILGKKNHVYRTFPVTLPTFCWCRWYTSQLPEMFPPLLPAFTNLIVWLGLNILSQNHARAGGFHHIRQRKLSAACRKSVSPGRAEITRDLWSVPRRRKPNPDDGDEHGAIVKSQHNGDTSHA